MDADRLGDVLRFDLRRCVAVVDPLQAVGGDLPAGLVHRRDRLGVAGHRGRDRIDGDRDAALGEHPMQAPEAGARAVFVDRFHVHVALARPGRGADDLRQERLGGGVAVQDVVLAAFLVVDDELHRHARAVRPVREGRRAPVADHVPRIVRRARHASTSLARSCASANSQRYDSPPFAPTRQMLQKRSRQLPAASKGPMTDISLSFEPPFARDRPRPAGAPQRHLARDVARAAGDPRRDRGAAGRARRSGRGGGRPFQRRRRHLRIRRGLPGRGRDARLRRRDSGRLRR